MNDVDKYFKRGWECIDPTPPPFEYDWDDVYEVDYSNDDYGEYQDMVNMPEHYTGSAIECIDAMEACASTEEFRGHLKLTAFKYVWRSGKKWNTTEDIDKAIWYLNKLKDTY